MKECPECKIKYDDEKKFCSECGTKLVSAAVKCPECGKDCVFTPLEKFTMNNCWDIRFYDEDGNADAAMAKKAFAWCKEEYPDWFSEKTPFVLERNRISWNSDEYSDDVDYSEIPSASPDSICHYLPENFIQDLGDGINAEIIIAEFISNNMEEEAESYYTSVAYEDDSAYVFNKFNFNSASALRLEKYGKNDCNTPGFAFNPKTFQDYKGNFRNKKTGERKLCGSVIGSVYEDEDGDIYWRMQFELNGEKSYVYNSSDDFVDTLDDFIKKSYHFDKNFEDNLISNFVEEENVDEADWEFAGFESAAAIFESYFGNNTAVNEDESDDEELDEEELDDEETDDEEFLEDEEYDDEEVLDETDEEDDDDVEDEQTVETNESEDIFEIKKNVLTWIDPSVKGRVVIPSGVTRISTAFNNVMTEVVLPETVTIISKYAFHRCSNLEKINIPKSVKKIGEGAFSHCEKLKEVVFEERTGPIEFGTFIFSDCRQLENPVLPEGITEIPESLFFMFITSIHLPSTIKQIGTSLEICQELVIYYNGTIKQWKALSKEGKTGPLTRRKIICTDGELGQLKPSHPSTKWMCIDGNTVVMCVTGASGEIVLPDYVTKIMNHAFSDCKKITEIKMPEGMTQICREAFSNCTQLKKINFPKTIKRLGKNLFKNCKSVEIVYSGTKEEWNAMNHSEDGTLGCDVKF